MTGSTNSAPSIWRLPTSGSMNWRASAAGGTRHLVEPLCRTFVLPCFVDEFERDAALQADAVAGQVGVGEVEMEVQRRQAVPVQRSDQVAGLLPRRREDDMWGAEYEFRAARGITRRPVAARHFAYADPLA
jgi:hypothetical protein